MLMRGRILIGSRVTLLVLKTGDSDNGRSRLLDNYVFPPASIMSFVVLLVETRVIYERVRSR